ncbi:MAG: carbamoyl phosphate synthase small subunit [Oscillospiraceae bacterium]|nr:carbamoyl phosphate synthase small subunit [Oscillospiraceae bacterium]
MKAYLVLENGTVFEGEYFGAVGEVVGEIVFTTGMTGYLETLTDPSYYGQIILQTFPLIGNYGVISADLESSGIHAKAYIVKHPCQTPSNFRNEGSLDAFLRERGIIGLCGIDTRALTKIIRKNGVMNGRITAKLPLVSDLDSIKSYRVCEPVAKVAGGGEVKVQGDCKRRVALIDFGAKRAIASALSARGCEVRTFPYNASVETILEYKPHGIMLSNGPGDPADPANAESIENIRVLQSAGIPIFGICLGHQLLALANGYSTQKLKFGHRGANQPVKEISTGRVYITSQNHGYEVIANRTKEQSFVNVNDGTCEGLDYGKCFSVQFHPEACGGPLDTEFLFDRFVDRIDESMKIGG